MKEESEKLKHGKQHEAAAFGAARKSLLDDLLGVEEKVAERAHALGQVVETQVIPKIEATVRGWVGCRTQPAAAAAAAGGPRAG